MNRASKLRLETCHKDLRILLSVAIKKFDILVLTGHVGEDEQRRKYIEDVSPFIYPDSAHNSSPSMAVDVRVYGVNDDYFAGCLMGMAYTLYDQGFITHRLTWGANRGLSKYHFELVRNGNE